MTDERLKEIEALFVPGILIDWAETQRGVDELILAVRELKKDRDFGYEQHKKLLVRKDRTVSAAFHALLEMSAWLGVPQDKRMKQIEHLMEGVKFRAEKDVDEVFYCTKETAK